MVKAKEKNWKKITLFWLGIFIVGGLGGVLFMRVLIPWLAGLPPFSNVALFCDVKEGTTIINKTEKVYLTQDLAYQEAISKIGNAAAAVQSGSRAGSGFILTSDGLVATTYSLAPKGSKIAVIRDNKEYQAQLVKQDKTNNLALLKITENNLPVVSFGDSANLKLGEMMLLVGAAKENDVFNRFANVGFIKTLAPELTFTFSETSLANGSALGNIKGEVLGLALVDKGGEVAMVGADKIKELMK